jgi:hypothetical protein
MQTSNNWLKVVISCVVSLLVVSSFLFLYDFPKKIDIEYPAMEYRVGKPESAEATTIKIKGTVRNPLFRGEPTFHGQFIVDKYDYTKKLIVWDMFMDRPELLYADNLEGTPVHRHLGYLTFADRFSRLNIVVAEELSKTKEMYREIYKDLRISAPAKNYEEAMKINKELYVP